MSQRSDAVGFERPLVPTVTIHHYTHWRYFSFLIFVSFILRWSYRAVLWNRWYCHSDWFVRPLEVAVGSRSLAEMWLDDSSYMQRQSESTMTPPPSFRVQLQWYWIFLISFWALTGTHLYMWSVLVLQIFLTQCVVHIYTYISVRFVIGRK